MKINSKTRNFELDSKSGAGEILFPNVFSKDGYIIITKESKEDDDKVEVKVGRDIQLKKVKSDIDTDEVTLSVETMYKNKLVKREVSRSMLNKRKIIDLQGFGFDVYDDNSNIVVHHLLNQEILSPIENVHTKIGYGEIEGKPVFKLYKAIGCNSKYNGKLKIKPKGEYKVWYDMVKRYVMGNMNLELTIAEGLSSAVIGLIGRDISLDTLIVHKYNDSSKGKTTALMLALSCFGCPDPKEKSSLAGTWLATNNALMALLKDNFGIARGLDEISMSGNINFTKDIYSLAGGREKERLGKDCKPQEVGEWSTTVISTGESSILSKANKNMGLRVRVIEEGHIEWTPNAKVSDKIKEVVIKNYGHAGIIFVNKLFELGKKEIIEIWRRWSQIMLDSIEVKDTLSDRIACKLAIIMTTAEIAKQALKLDFDLVGIQQLLTDIEKSCKEDRDLGLSAYKYFIEQFNIHKAHFEIPEIIKTANGSRLENKEIWGTYKVLKNGSIEVCVIPSIFKKLMNQGDFEDVNIILQNWKTKELLSYEEGHNTRKRKINTSKPIPVYCIQIKEIVEEENTP